MLVESGEVNRDAWRIATSVVNGDRFQSYVTRDYPRWLLGDFLSESGSYLDVSS